MGLMSCSHLSKSGSEILLSRFGQLDPLKTNQISISHLLTERAGTKLLFWQRRTNSYFLFFAFFSFRNMIHSFLLLRSFNLFLVHMSTFHFFFLYFIMPGWKRITLTRPGHAILTTPVWYVEPLKNCVGYHRTRMPPDMRK